MAKPVILAVDDEPDVLEPGVFAAGAARYGSGKRVASAVGEGSATVSLVHEYLATVQPADVFSADRRSKVQFPEATYAKMRDQVIAKQAAK